MLLDLWGLIQKNLFRGANSGGKKPLVVVEYKGIEYRLTVDELPAFLAARKEEAKPFKQKHGKPMMVTIPEKVVLIEAPVGHKVAVKKQIDQTNKWIALVLRELQERDDEETLLILLGV